MTTNEKLKIKNNDNMTINTVTGLWVNGRRCTEKLKCYCYVLKSKSEKYFFLQKDTFQNAE